MSSGRRSGHGMPPITRRQREEDLVLFKEMIKREERTVSLLQPISVEFEPGEGNYRLYKIPSGKKDADFLAADGKNDYDWLKTPPGTPLFPSLDLEAEDPLLNMAVHKELPILQPIKPSRLSNHVHADRSKHSQRTKSPSTISTAGSSLTSITGSSSMSITPRLIKAEAHSIHRTINISSSLKSNDQRGNETIYNSESKQMPPRITTTTATRQNFDRKLPPNCRPQIRSKLAQTVVEFTDETPKNLITETRPNNRRTSSTMRGRSMAMADERQQEGGRNIRRVSCSPISTMRGRKTMDLGMEYDGTKLKIIHNSNDNGNGNRNRNGGVVVGSRMVERMMNARKTITDHEKPKAAAITAGTGISGTTRFEGSSFGSSILKTSITLQEPDEKKIESEGVARPTNRLRSTTPTTNTVLKRESQRDEKKNENGVANVPRMKMRSSTPTSATVYTREFPRMNTTPDYETTRILRGRLNAESQIIVKKGNPRNRCGLC